MISKKDITKMVKHLMKKRSGVPDRRMMHPERDWLIGLLGVTLVFVGGAFYAGSLFIEYSKRAGAEISASSDVIKYDQKLIAKVLEQYDAMSTEFDSLRADRSNRGSEPAVEEDSQDNEEFLEALAEELEG